MDLGSSYVLDEASGEDYFDDSVLNDEASSGSGTGSGSLSDEEVPVEEVKEEKRLRKVRKADTNLLAVNLGSLAEETELFTGLFLILGKLTFKGKSRSAVLAKRF
jgi:hypothetical protein